MRLGIPTALRWLSWRDELVDQTFSVNPAVRVDANAERAGAIGNYHGLAEACYSQGAPHRAHSLATRARSGVIESAVSLSAVRHSSSREKWRVGWLASLSRSSWSRQPSRLMLDPKLGQSPAELLVLRPKPRHFGHQIVNHANQIAMRKTGQRTRWRERHSAIETPVSMPGNPPRPN